VGNRKDTIKFYTEVLGMKVLRHEEFEEGCKATCNGPYDGKWSKTMVGYGSENDHFVVELTYNYGVKSYQLGDDYQYITIHSKKSLQNASAQNYPVELQPGENFVAAPDGYRFKLVDQDVQENQDPVQSITLQSSNLDRTLEFWNSLLQLPLNFEDECSNGDRVVSFSFGPEQASLEFIEKASNQGKALDHATAFGRIAFSCPSSQLKIIEASVKKFNPQFVKTPYVSLDTPGKATVQVVILVDPDGYEICFVGDEGFRELSTIDPKAASLLEEAISQDKSVEWFEKRAQRLANSQKTE